MFVHFNRKIIFLCSFNVCVTILYKAQQVSLKKRSSFLFCSDETVGTVTLKN